VTLQISIDGSTQKDAIYVLLLIYTGLFEMIVGVLTTRFTRDMKFEFAMMTMACVCSVQIT